MKLLQIAPDLVLPPEIVAKRLAFLGMTGSGKTYAAMKLAELMIAAGIQVVVVDVVGVWWGLRVAADGKKPGIQIPVFGGLHGDVPIEPTTGDLIAEVVVDRNLSCVIDISQMDSDTDALRFARDFGKHVFDLRKRKPSAMMIFLEECQELVPENPMSQMEKLCLHAWKRAVKIGRNFGIGIALISQRPQEISKKALNLAEVVFAFQMSGKHEREAVKAWIHQVGGEDNIVDLLPRLDVGRPYVYSPRLLKVSRVFHIGERWTFDASATPEIGEDRNAQVKPLSADDMKQLAERMAESIERAKAEDPKELQKTIAEMGKELAILKSQKPATVKADDAALQKAFERGAKSVKAELGKAASRVHNHHQKALQKGCGDGG